MNAFNTYSFPEARNIIICGDIHGEFNTLIFKLCIQYQLTDTLLIVAGDCGFGFEKPLYYDSVIKRCAQRLNKAGNWVVMVRGNHDDPSYFREERIHHKRFRCVPDYSVIQACGHNILCIGGAVSIDRENRKKRDSRCAVAGVASYWTDEEPVYDEAALSAVVRAIRIDTVVTHTAPSFCELISKSGLAEWAALDADIPSDCAKERETMDRILSFLRAAEQPLSRWYYGHFHQSWSSEIEGILFSMLDIMEFKEMPVQ